ncbi:nuclear transport factor 2 family protein [Nocardioides caldifontis]|uniref:nuclear transport factor 2 family protein n=1 Tax=Nocardioides caldifontis TaxID=2588938 RepID=UPI0011DF6C55|nr:nuclear transport factor 2 family protein [Nocardioides caldifontis]
MTSHIDEDQRGERRGESSAGTASTNVRAVEQAYRAFERGDLDGFTALMSDRFVSRQSDAVPWRGSHVGPAGVGSMFALVEQHARAAFSPDEIIDGGDRVVVIGRAEITPVTDGRPRVVRELHVWSVELGTLTGLDVFLNAPSDLLAALEGSTERIGGLAQGAVRVADDGLPVPEAGDVHVERSEPLQ